MTYFLCIYIWQFRKVKRTKFKNNVSKSYIKPYGEAGLVDSCNICYFNIHCDLAQLHKTCWIDSMLGSLTGWYNWLNAYCYIQYMLYQRGSYATFRLKCVPYPWHSTIGDLLQFTLPLSDNNNSCFRFLVFL